MKHESPSPRQDRDAADEAARRALYRRLEGFEGREPLLCRDPVQLGYQRSAYWCLAPGLYLRRAPLPQVLLLATALGLLIVLWPVTMALALGLLRLVLVLRFLLIPAGVLLLAFWLWHSMRRPHP